MLFLLKNCVKKNFKSYIKLAISIKNLYNVIMVVIRRLNCFDYPKVKKLISYLCNDDNDMLAKSLMEEPLGLLNAMMPLKFKFKSESFVLIENNEILGLVTVVCTLGNPYKINIIRLIFKENRYEIGKQLIEFVVQKIGAKGASNFVVTIDECHEELFDLFVNGCGFRQCSSEVLWKIENPMPVNTNLKFRNAQNSDAEMISELYNSEIINIFKPSLLRNKREFMEPVFSGFVPYYKKRFVMYEDKNLLCYCSITTADNLNYIIDITTNDGYEFDYDEILNSLLYEIAQKKRVFYPLIKQKKYTKTSLKFEEYLKNKGYNPIQTSHILVKDFYKPVKETSQAWQVFLLGENQIS